MKSTCDPSRQQTDSAKSHGHTACSLSPLASRSLPGQAKKELSPAEHPALPIGGGIISESGGDYFSEQGGGIISVQGGGFPRNHQLNNGRGRSNQQVGEKHHAIPATRTTAAHHAARSHPNEDRRADYFHRRQATAPRWPCYVFPPAGNAGFCGDEQISTEASHRKGLIGLSWSRIDE
jgi:hypothetical protein